MNTAIAALMTMVNEFYSNGLTRGDFEALLLMLSPFAPHMVEELWEQKGFAAKYGKMAMQMPWPEYDESKTVASHVEMAVQVIGKLKGTITVPVDSDQDTVVEAAKQREGRQGTRRHADRQGHSRQEQARQPDREALLSGISDFFKNMRKDY